MPNSRYPKCHSHDSLWVKLTGHSQGGVIRGRTLQQRGQHLQGLSVAKKGGRKRLDPGILGIIWDYCEDMTSMTSNMEISWIILGVI